ncbi:MAG: HEAT repeat domain-containing protein [Spirochaetes bacterium]|nr:HEAT repeat domain-containing protein [Spirochaetota bacterium]
MKTALLCLIITAAVSTAPARAAGAAKKSEKAAAPAAKETAMSDEKKADMLEQTLEYGIQEERARAMGTIQKFKDPGLRAKLAAKVISLMKDEEDPELLIKAMTVLGEMKEPSARSLMTEKLEHRSEDVRTSAVYGLKKIQATEAKDRLVEKLKGRDLGENSTYTSALIDALGEFKAAEMVPFIRESLQSPKTSKTIKEEMVIFLGKVPAAESKEILLKIYKDEAEENTLRAYAVNSLSKLGIKEAAGDIKEVMAAIDAYESKKRKRYYTLYLYSIAALARLGDPEAIPKLIQSLRSNSAQVRLKAISLIKGFKDKRTIDILKYKMKYDPNLRVQKAAKKALEEMGVETEEKKGAKK